MSSPTSAQVCSITDALVHLQDHLFGPSLQLPRWPSTYDAAQNPCLSICIPPPQVSNPTLINKCQSVSDQQQHHQPNERPYSCILAAGTSPPHHWWRPGHATLLHPSTQSPTGSFSVSEPAAFFILHLESSFIFSNSMWKGIKVIRSFTLSLLLSLPPQPLISFIPFQPKQDKEGEEKEEKCFEHLEEFDICYGRLGDLRSRNTIQIQTNLLYIMSLWQIRTF